MDDKQKEKVVFVRRISRSGKNLTKLISIPVSVRDLVGYGKIYKITMEEMKEENDNE